MQRIDSESAYDRLRSELMEARLAYYGIAVPAFLFVAGMVLFFTVPERHQPDSGAQLALACMGLVCGFLAAEMGRRHFTFRTIVCEIERIRERVAAVERTLPTDKTMDSGEA